jgi:Tfp pilus assembly major pilin PilA
MPGGVNMEYVILAEIRTKYVRWYEFKGYITEMIHNNVEYNANIQSSDFSSVYYHTEA